MSNPSLVLVAEKILLQMSKGEMTPESAALATEALKIVGDAKQVECMIQVARDQHRDFLCLVAKIADRDRVAALELLERADQEAGELRSSLGATAKPATEPKDSSRRMPKGVTGDLRDYIILSILRESNPAFVANQEIYGKALSKEGSSLTQNAFTTHLQRMKERGLVERQVKDDKDKKGFWQITSEGRDRLSALPEELESKGIELPR